VRGAVRPACPPARRGAALEPEPGSVGGPAVRLGSRMVAGLAEADGRAMTKAPRAGNGALFAYIEAAALGGRIAAGSVGG
jgi:hypothetical protein